MAAVFFAVIATALLACSLGVSEEAGSYAFIATIFAASCGYALGIRRDR